LTVTIPLISDRAFLEELIGISHGDLIGLVLPLGIVLPPFLWPCGEPSALIAIKHVTAELVQSHQT
jgi:hypothetical protein